jgi:hypothetical protein
MDYERGRRGRGRGKERQGKEGEGEEILVRASSPQLQARLSTLRIFTQSSASSTSVSRSTSIAKSSQPDSSQAPSAVSPSPRSHNAKLPKNSNTKHPSNTRIPNALVIPDPHLVTTVTDLFLEIETLRNTHLVQSDFAFPLCGARNMEPWRFGCGFQGHFAMSRSGNVMEWRSCSGNLESTCEGAWRRVGRKV